MKILIPMSLMCFGALTLSACTPTVRVEAPQKPITINLNVKVQQEVRVKVERDVDKLFNEKKGIF